MITTSISRRPCFLNNPTRLLSPSAAITSKNSPRNAHKKLYNERWNKNKPRKWANRVGVLWNYLCSLNRISYSGEKFHSKLILNKRRVIGGGRNIGGYCTVFLCLAFRIDNPKAPKSTPGSPGMRPGFVKVKNLTMDFGVQRERLFLLIPSDVRGVKL